MCHHIWFEDIFIWLSSFVPQTHAEVKKVGIPAPSGKTGWYSLGARGRRDTRHSPPPSSTGCLKWGPFGPVQTLGVRKKARYWS